MGSSNEYLMRVMNNPYDEKSCSRTDDVDAIYKKIKSNSFAVKDKDGLYIKVIEVSKLLDILKEIKIEEIFNLIQDINPTEIYSHMAEIDNLSDWCSSIRNSIENNLGVVVAKKETPTNESENISDNIVDIMQVCIDLRSQRDGYKEAWLREREKCERYEKERIK